MHVLASSRQSVPLAGGHFCSTVFRGSLTAVIRPRYVLNMLGSGCPAQVRSRSAEVRVHVGTTEFGCPSEPRGRPMTPAGGVPSTATMSLKRPLNSGAYGRIDLQLTRPASRRYFACVVPKPSPTGSGSTHEECE